MKTLKLFMTFLLSFSITGVVLFGCESDETKSPEFSVNPDSVVIEALGEVQTLNIISASEWIVNNSADWLQISKMQGTGNAEITLSAEELSTEEGRNTTISISNNDQTIEIKVIQNGVDPWGGFVFQKEPDETNMRSLSMNELTLDMGLGWNLGNSLEAIGGETAWGNPIVTKKLIDSVKAAGFNMVRIPVAWSVFSNEANYEIDLDWMNRVEEVVNYVLDNDMYVMLNIHWDGGWMQPLYATQSEVNNRLKIMWTQIATHFRDYNDKLLFAGTNEVHVEGDYGAPSEENATVQNEFNQIFVNTVRKTGGRNVYRYLIFQSYNTNIDHGINYALVPKDVVDSKLLVEVHYYDPYNFALNQNSSITQWGSNADDASKVESWANESFVDGQFNKMKTNFYDKGIGVILGEYGAISRPNIDGHEAYREYYIEYITKSAVEHGIVPVYWDNGHAGEYGFALFDRESGAQVYPNLIQSINKAITTK